METTLMLRRLQEELADELQRMGQLRDVFQAQHFADEVDAASHLEAAHLAQCSARRSAQRIRDLQSLLHLLQHNGPRQCVDCGDDIPLERLMAAPGTTRCLYCQQQMESMAYPLTGQRESAPAVWPASWSASGPASGSASGPLSGFDAGVTPEVRFC